MREEGIIKGSGLGVNRPEPIMKPLDVQTRMSARSRRNIR
jgi:hypothetical protein